MGNNLPASSPTSNSSDPEEEYYNAQNGANDEIFSRVPSFISFENDGYISSELQLESGSATDLEMTLRGSDLDDVSEDGWEESESNTDDNSTKSLCDTPVENTSTKLKIYSSSEIKIDHAIGEGEFGKVSKGILQGKNRLPVAVRVFRTGFEGRDTIGQLNAIMKLKHRNVVSVLGVLDSPNRQSDSAYGPKILLHYFPEGNLLQYLFKPDNPHDHATLVKLALDVIQGCEYLHSKNVVHGNLAARNVLIEKQRGKVLTHYNAKVTDHGIIQLVKARGIGKNYMAHNDGFLPLRWVPKELLEENSTGFTFSSDVWSFGVLFWEMLTKGSIPYGRKKEDSVSDSRRVFELIMKGQSPMDIRVPLVYSDEIINVLKQIFKVNPLERPTFHDLRKEFISISASFKSLGKESKSKLETRRDDRQNLAMQKYATDNHGSQREWDESRSREVESSLKRGRGRRRTIAIGGTGRHCKPNFFCAKEVNNNTKASPTEIEQTQSTESREWTTYRSSRSTDTDDEISIRPLVYQFIRGSSYQASSRNHREVAQPTSSRISTLRGISSEPESLGASVNTLPHAPPPPYTLDLPPNHSVYDGIRGEIKSFVRESRGPRKPNFTKEIKKKEQELENLKFQKLQHDIQKASKTWDKKMQHIESQIAELKGVSFPASRSGNAEFACPLPPPPDFRRERERSRASKPPSVRGGGGGRGQYIHRGKERTSTSIYGK